MNAQVQQPFSPGPTAVRLSWWRQLRWNLIAVLVVLVVAPVAMVVAVTLTRVGAQSNEQVTNQLQSLADIKQREITRWITDSSNTLEVLLAGSLINDRFVIIGLGRPGYQFQIDVVRDILQSVASQHEGFAELFFYDPKGLIIVSSDEGQDGKIVSRQPYFEDSLQRRTVVQSPYYEVGSNNLTMIITRQIADTDGTLAGVLAARLDLGLLGALMSSVEGLGDTGQTYLVSLQSNYLLTPSRFPGFELTRAYHSEGIDRALRGENGSGAYHDFRGQPVLGVYRWIPELQAGLLAEYEQSEAQQAFRTVRDFAFGLTIAGIVAAVLIGLYAAGRLTRPINVLANAAARLAGGDLNVRARLGVQNEVGLLANAFNEMASQLQGMVGSLESRVQARTRDLFLTLEVGQLATQIYRREELLTRIVDYIRQRFDLYYTQVYMIDDGQRYAVLAAGTGNVGRQLLERRHRLDLRETSIVARAFHTRRPVLVSDTTTSPVHKANPLLPDTRSEVAIPLIVGDMVIGVLDMQAAQAGTFREDNLPVFEAMASQLASALRTAAAYAETEDAVSRATAINRRLTAQAWESYLGSVGEGQRVGFQYDLQEVQPLAIPAQQAVASRPTALTRPIKLRDQVIGSIALGEADQRTWEPFELDLIDSVAERVAAALDQFRAFDETASSQRLLRAVLDNIPVWVFAKDREFRFILANKVFAEFYGGRDPEDIIGLDDYALGSPVELVEGDPERGIEGFRTTDRRALQGETVLILDDHVQFADGSMHVLETIKVPLVNNQGEIIGVLGVARDVTEQRAAQAERERLLQETARRATEMQTVAQVGAEASTTLDPTTLLRTVSHLTKERFGLYHAHVYLVDEARENLLLVAGAGEAGALMVERGHSIPLNRPGSLVARAAREGAPVIVNDVRETPDFLPNPLLPETRSEMAVPMIVGREVIGVLDVQSEQLDRFGEQDEQVLGTLAAQVAVAVNNARLFAEQVRTADRLREVDRLKSEFLASMSHELRTPLNSIIGYAEVLLDGIDGELNDEMNEDVSAIHGSGKHLLNLINDILDLAKIEAGQMDLVIETLDLRPLAEEMMNASRVLVKDRAVDLVIDLPDDLPLLRADPLRLRQIINNLITNAVKFTEEGSITLWARRDGENPAMMHLGVTDTGIGMTEQQAAVIFDRFRQVDQSHTRRAGGTGLGLSITRQLVQMHGGDIWVETAPGTGSTFHFRLPLAVTERLPVLEQ